MIGVQVYCDIYQIPEGVGAVQMTPGEANAPGQGQTGTPRPVAAQQAMRVQAFECVSGVTGTTAVTLAQLLTTLQTIASDLAGASGTPIITPALLAVIQGWATGNP